MGFDNCCLASLRSKRFRSLSSGLPKGIGETRFFFRFHLSPFPPETPDTQASVSVRFRSKERGTRVKDRAKNGVSKRAGRGWLLFHFSCGQNRENACYAVLSRLLSREILLPLTMRAKIVALKAWVLEARLSNSCKTSTTIRSVQ